MSHNILSECERLESLKLDLNDILEMLSTDANHPFGEIEEKIKRALAANDLAELQRLYTELTE